MPEEQGTVWHAFYQLLRSYGITTIFGNPGSTEEPMLKNFPSDFKYVFALQEASVVAMADGYAQASKTPAIVSLHTAAGTGNGMGNIMTAFLNKTPLIIIAGQQTREMLIGDPFLTNREATILPQPWVKWSYQPVRALDVPQTMVRAIATALLPPAGPVYLSIPLDDWDVPFDMSLLPKPRVVSTKVAPDPSQLANFVDVLKKSKKVGMVLGAEVDKSMAWPSAIELAELLQVSVFQPPLAERASFPETHPLFRGSLPSAKGPMAQLLAQYEFDTVLVIGCEVWRYYPWVPGPELPNLKILHVTSDPHDAASAFAGDCLLSDAGLAMEALYQALRHSVDTKGSEGEPLHRHRSQMHAVEKPARAPARSEAHSPMTDTEAFSAVAAVRPQNTILVCYTSAVILPPSFVDITSQVHETPSNAADLVEAWQITEPESYYTFASGGLGWGGPASVGIALAQKVKQSGRPVVLVIGDGSFQYSIQSIYSAVQLQVKLIILVPVNEEYAILKEFAELEKTPNVPSLDIPYLDAKRNAIAYGCPAFRAESPSELQVLFGEALQRAGPSVIEFPIDRSLKPLVRTPQAKPGLADPPITAVNGK